MKKVLFSFLCVLLLCSFALSASAEWESPFEDVKGSHWYYNAVKTTVEKGIFSGMSENSFKPNAKMTRAMFVTTLAKTVGAEVGEYTGTPFTDVKAGDWFAPYVEWAYKNGITSGVSEDKFGVNNSITREQMVTLFYNTAKKTGQDTAIEDLFKYNKTLDKNEIDSWAEEAMKWALCAGIVSGSGTEGTSILVDPNGTATRAQAAQIIVKYLEFTEKDLPPVTGLTVNGNPIEIYSIVYNADDANSKNFKEGAETLYRYIYEATGVALPIISDAEESTGYEIIVGFTNREDMGIVSAQRTETDRGAFEIHVQGNNVIITNTVNHKYSEGCEFGARAFAEELLGYKFYMEGEKEIVRSEGINIPDGYSFTDCPGFEYRVIYWGEEVTDARSAEPFSKYGMVHNIGELAETGGQASDNPCLTDPDILATIEKNFLNIINSRPGLEAMWVSQNDQPGGCMCESCVEVYRREGSRAATIIELCNHLCEVAEPINPGLELWTLAYEYTTIPVKSKMDENIVVYYCTIDNCASHAYNDPSCPQNRGVYNNVTGWSEVCDKMYVWEYSTNFIHSLCPMPIISANIENRNFYYELGVRGEFNNATTDTVGEFGALKAFCLEMLQWDPTISHGEYYSKVEDFMTGYYGPGGKYILEYINKTEELSDKNCFSYSSVPSAVISNEDVDEWGDHFNALWDKAEALCENQKQKDRIRLSRLHWTYTYLDAVYEDWYTNGDAASRKLYADMATAFYNEAIAFDVNWTHTGKSTAFDATKSPVSWVD